MKKLYKPKNQTTATTSAYPKNTLPSSAAQKTKTNPVDPTLLSVKDRIRLENSQGNTTTTLPTKVTPLHNTPAKVIQAAPRPSTTSSSSANQGTPQPTYPAPGYRWVNGTLVPPAQPNVNTSSTTLPAAPIARPAAPIERPAAVREQSEARARQSEARALQYEALLAKRLNDEKK
jgi:hypothetical protein